MALCPDPSAHRDTKLQEQASTAALYATSPARKPKPSPDASEILDKNNKLSSKSAAMSLKHAQPQDLPSFPSTGGVTTNHSGNAALMANDNHKQFEHWKPDASSAAGKAALLAKDYKMAPLWQPEASAAGSKAATLAAKDGGKLNLWYPEATPEGNSAAAQAMRKPAPKPIEVVTADTRNKALLAATASVSRARSGSTPASPPAQYPDSANSTYNALNAATAANRQPKTKDEDVFDSPALEQSRIKHLSDKISKDMWTERPPVEIELEEQRHQAALRASAVSMAKSMYTLAERNRTDGATSHAGATAASAAADRSSFASSSPDLKQQAMQYIHLQEAAQRLAGERLAKLDPDGAAKFREHYGYPIQSPGRRKLTTKSTGRSRGYSGSQLSDSDDDEMTSRRIRNQMSIFSKELDAVDEKKRASDRANLLAAAERKVQAQMKGLDAQVYANTGKVSPAMMEEWERKAREKAAQDSAVRTQNFGKTNIGGGKFMSTAEIEAIAAARLKPTLDEITDNAEKRRARDEEIRLDMEEKKRQEAMEKLRQKEIKAAEKHNKQEEKAAAKKAKEAEKQRVLEEKRKSREAARQSKEVKPVVPTATATAGATPIVGEGLVEQVKDEVEHDHEPEEAESESEHEYDSDDDVFADAKDEQVVTPFIERTATGEAVLRPDIERHVTEIPDSEDEEEHAKDVKKETEHIGPYNDDSAHIGTDGPIGKSARESLDINDKDKEPASPRSPKRISKLLTKLRRKSKPPTPDFSKTAEKKPPTEKAVAALATDEPATETTAFALSNEDASPVKGKAPAVEEPAESSADKPTIDLAPLSLTADYVAEPAAASPSSFVRGRPRSGSVSSLESDSGRKTSLAKETKFQEEL